MDRGEALELFKSKTFDAVFMDLKILEADDCDLAVEMRRWETENHKMPVPLVVLAENSVDLDHGQCFQAGCTDFMLKPLKKHLFLEFLDKLESNQA